MNKFLPQLEQSQTIFNYEGIGVTNKQISEVIEEFDKQQKTSAHKKFKMKYVNYLKNGREHPDNTDLEDWLKNLKIRVPHEYPYIIKLANEYNEKNNISIRY